MAEQSAGIVGNAKKLGNDVKQAGRSVWLVGLGALAAAEEETRGVVDRLKAKGEEVEKSETTVMRKLYDRATGEVKKVGTHVEDAVRCTVGSALHRAGVPSRDEIRELIDRVETLTAKVDSLGAAHNLDQP